MTSNVKVTTKVVTLDAEGDALHACAVCGQISNSPRCPQHQRGTPRERGYGRTFIANRTRLFADNPNCVTCSAPAIFAHHRPPRRRLIAMGVTDPDAIEFLEPLCRNCHARETAAGR